MLWLKVPHFTHLGLFLIFSLVAPGSALGASLRVPGTANPWLAGRPDGFTDGAGDSTPANSPILFDNFVDGATLKFSVPDSDRAGYSYGSESGPDGNLTYPVNHPKKLGIGAIQLVPANALVGVFLNSSEPDAQVETPSPMNFGDAPSRDYLELRPALNQPFYIGNGRTGSGQSQAVIAPTGAVRLFLGIMDGTGWFNNTGFFDVEVSVPPVTYALDLVSEPAETGSLHPNPLPDNDGRYVAGTMVEISAFPISGYYLHNWLGADSVVAERAQVTLTGPRVVTAVFNRMELEAPFDRWYECLVSFLDDYGDGAANPSASKVRIATAPSRTGLDLGLLRAFRDQVLARTEEGETLINLFYKYSPEIIYHTFTSAELRTAVTNAIVSLQPLLWDMTYGSGEAVISGAQIESIDTVIRLLSEGSGVGLKQAIQTQLARVGSLDQFEGKTSAQVRLDVAAIQLAITNVRINNGRAEFMLTGVLPGGTLHVEWSEDFRTWIEWNPAPVVTSLPVILQDPLPLQASHRYYRVRSAP